MLYHLSFKAKLRMVVLLSSMKFRNKLSSITESLMGGGGGGGEGGGSGTALLGGPGACPPENCFKLGSLK